MCENTGFSLCAHEKSTCWIIYYLFFAYMYGLWVFYRFCLFFLTHFRVGDGFWFWGHHKRWQFFFWAVRPELFKICKRWRVFCPHLPFPGGLLCYVFVSDNMISTTEGASQKQVVFKWISEPQLLTSYKMNGSPTENLQLGPPYNDFCT